jgi:pimeloyl-ACP methyl ester carboxylesterase
VYYYFPGNYTWSLAVHTALRCGAQIGEIDRGCSKLREMADPTAEDWVEAWTSIAEQQESLAAEDLARGYEIGAGDRLQRASIYHIMAERQMQPGDRKSECYRRFLDAFGRAIRLSKLPWERIEVQIPEGPLPAYFIPAPGPGPKPTMLFFDGFDTSKEILSMTARDTFARRGLNLLVADSPGVGEPLRLHGMPSRPDYEVPAAAFVDYLETRDDVDSDRLGVFGVSLGGYYAPRAATFEKRFKCCAAWGAIWDWGETWQDRWARMSKTVSVPHWQLPWVMGTDTMEEALERVKQWSLVGVLDQLTQPFLILHGEHDQQIPLRDAYSALEAAGSEDKQLRVFTIEEGGAEHCQCDEPNIAIQLIADWSAQKLAAVP